MCIGYVFNIGDSTCLILIRWWVELIQREPMSVQMMVEMIQRVINLAQMLVEMIQRAWMLAIQTTFHSWMIP